MRRRLGKRGSTASGQALRRRRPQQIYCLETAAVCYRYSGGESAPPTNEHTLYDKDAIIVYVRNENTPISASCEVGWIRSSMVLSAYENFRAQRVGVYGIGFFVLSLPDLTQPWKFLLCTPWQCCRTYIWARFTYILDHYGRARSRGRASARRVEAPLK